MSDRRGARMEHLAVLRCKTQDAKKALENYFKRNAEITHKAGIKAAVTLKKQANGDFS